jgi:hypothetical protein
VGLAEQLLSQSRPSSVLAQGQRGDGSDGPLPESGHFGGDAGRDAKTREVDRASSPGQAGNKWGHCVSRSSEGAGTFARATSGSLSSTSHFLVPPLALTPVLLLVWRRAAPSLYSWAVVSLAGPARAAGGVGVPGRVASASSARTRSVPDASPNC